MLLFIFFSWVSAKMIIRTQLITSRRDNKQLAWGSAPGIRWYDKRPARAKAPKGSNAFALAGRG